MKEFEILVHDFEFLVHACTSEKHAPRKALLRKSCTISFTLNKPYLFIQRIKLLAFKEIKSYYAYLR